MAALLMSLLLLLYFEQRSGRLSRTGFSIQFIDLCMKRDSCIIVSFSKEQAACCDARKPADALPVATCVWNIDHFYLL